MISPIHQALGAFLIASGLLMAAWAISTIVRNAGFVDVAWSFAFTLLSAFYLLAGSGFGPRRWLIGGMVILWSLRLGSHLLIRVLHHHPEEDTRYAKIRRSWGGSLSVGSPPASSLSVNLKFLVFFEAQAVLAALLSIPFIFVCANPEPGIQPMEWSGLFLWCVALAGESLADSQLRAFRADPANREKVCDAGFWRYSRHPNYFFEWLVWTGYAVFALASPLGWTALLSAGVMLIFLRFVTGVPPAEAQSIASKGDAYRRYQEKTNAFIPWFRKTA